MESIGKAMTIKTSRNLAITCNTNGMYARGGIISDKEAIIGLQDLDYRIIGGTLKLPINRLNKSSIKKVIFNPPATIIIFNDDSKIVVKCKEDEEFNPEVGFAMAMMKVMFGSRGEFSRFIEKYNK